MGDTRSLITRQPQPERSSRRHLGRVNIEPNRIAAERLCHCKHRPAPAEWVTDGAGRSKGKTNSGKRSGKAHGVGIDKATSRYHVRAGRTRTPMAAHRNEVAIARPVEINGAHRTTKDNLMPENAAIGRGGGILYQANLADERALVLAISLIENNWAEGINRLHDKTRSLVKPCSPCPNIKAHFGSIRQAGNDRAEAIVGAKPWQGISTENLTHGQLPKHR